MSAGDCTASSLCVVTSSVSCGVHAKPGVTRVDRVVDEDVKKRGHAREVTIRCDEAIVVVVNKAAMGRRDAKAWKSTIIIMLAQGIPASCIV
jgi:RNA:NAD 2'-phosphotransferase (TPT1/KptA family)